jgi:hypothetical protein
MEERSREVRKRNVGTCWRWATGAKMHKATNRSSDPPPSVDDGQDCDQDGDQGERPEQ